jgi:hypothetical protein
MFGHELSFLDKGLLGLLFLGFCAKIVIGRLMKAAEQHPEAAQFFIGHAKNKFNRWMK